MSLTEPSPSTTPAAAAEHVWQPAVLKRFVRRLGRSSADCEDIVQDAYLRLLESSGSGRVLGSPFGYLLVIARNLVADAGRRDSLEGRRTRALKVLSSQLKPSAPSTEELVFVEQSRDRLAAALRRLPGRARKAFLLHRFHALQHTEIAARMGVTTRTVERDLALALSTLKDALFEGDFR